LWRLSPGVDAPRKDAGDAERISGGGIDSGEEAISILGTAVESILVRALLLLDRLNGRENVFVE
jgi:hypothetical protein